MDLGPMITPFTDEDEDNYLSSLVPSAVSPYDGVTDS